MIRKGITLVVLVVIITLATPAAFAQMSSTGVAPGAKNGLYRIDAARDRFVERIHDLGDPARVYLVIKPADPDTVAASTPDPELKALDGASMFVVGTGPDGRIVLGGSVGEQHYQFVPSFPRFPAILIWIAAHLHR